MKKILYLAVVCISLLSCSEDKLPSGKAIGLPSGKAGGSPTITVQPASITLGSDGTAQTIKVSSNTSWSVSSDEAWVKYSPTSGTGGSSITVSATTNTGEERYTRLTFKDRTGMVTSQLLVTQEKAATEKEEITVDKTSLTFSADGGSESITITSNFDWEAISKPNWITISPSTGSNGTTNVTVSVSKNDTNNSRQGTITFGKSSDVVSIFVIQNAPNAKNEISSSDTILLFNSSGGSKEIVVTSNFDWETISKPNCITISPSTGSNGTTNVTVSVSALSDNPVYNPRSHIALGYGYYEMKVVLGISSDTVPVIIRESVYLDILHVDYKYLTFSEDGGSVDMYICALGSWEITSKPDWITTSSSNGTKGKQKVTFSASAFSDSRSGTITLEDEFSSKATITVYQDIGLTTHGTNINP